MCGIAGFSLNPSDRVDVNKLAVALLHEIERRGRDATGVAWHTGIPGDVHLVKRNVPARQFTPALDITGATVAVLHTRWATQGDPKHNVNNHPIRVGATVGVHNGHINNDDDVFARLDVRRIGQVDSEAIFAYLEHGPARFGTDDPTVFLSELRGGAAVAWLRDNDRTLRVARVQNSPLAVARTPGGSFVFASTAALLRSALNTAGITVTAIQEINEGSYLEIVDGETLATRKFTPARGYTPRPARTHPARTSDPTGRAPHPARVRTARPITNRPAPAGPSPTCVGVEDGIPRAVLAAVTIGATTRLLIDTTRDVWMYSPFGDLQQVNVTVTDRMLRTVFDTTPGGEVLWEGYAHLTRAEEGTYPQVLLVPEPLPFVPNVPQDIPDGFSPLGEMLDAWMAVQAAPR